MQNSSPVGFAILGVGQLTREQLLPALGHSKGATLRALVTDDVEATLEVARKFGLSENDVYHSDDFFRLQERSDIEAVWIVLPNHLHREYTEKAASVGLHVLCEKPLATTPEDAAAMAEACETAGVKLMTAYRCQYLPEHWAIREAVQSGRLGQIRSIESTHSHTEEEAGVWRLKKAASGGGPLPDIGLYSLNIVRFLLNEEPKWVFADRHDEQRDARFREVEERISWMMGFSGGVNVVCHCSFDSQATSTLRVVGSQGAALLEPAFNYQGLRLRFSWPDGDEIPRFPRWNAFALEFDHFARAIRQNVPPFSTGEDGLRDMLHMEAIYRSAELGTRIDLPDFAPLRRGPKPDLPSF